MGELGRHKDPSRCRWVAVTPGTQELPERFCAAPSTPGSGSWGSPGVRALPPVLYPPLTLGTVPDSVQGGASALQ